MEFRLIYDGALPAESRGNGRVAEKHDIRKQLHRQLFNLWCDHPLLKNGFLKSRESERPGSWKEVSLVDKIANAYERFGYRFVPLIRKSQGVTCSIDILFLRKDVPGGLIDNRGDIDNRIKVLFDGLRIPDKLDEVADSARRRTGFRGEREKRSGVKTNAIPGLKVNRDSGGKANGFRPIPERRSR